MFQKLVSHNDDIRRLVEIGYAVAFDSNHLLVRDIPYLDNNKELLWGTIVAKLVFDDLERVSQDDHQIYFAGSVPHNIDGSPIPNLGGGETQIPLSEAASDVVVQRSFSNKPMPAGKYDDFFHKIDTYVTLISGPPIALHGADPLTFNFVEKVPESVFNFHDTLTSRAEITDLAANFSSEVVAVIGLGGTGSYLLDFLVKSPVREIRGFDADVFQVHNGFRSPGMIREPEFRQPKAEVYQKRYEQFRKGVELVAKYIDASSEAELEGVTFAFVSVDKGSSRAGIFDLLLSKRIPFIDVGMGLNRKHGPINGTLKATYYSAEDGKTILEKNLAELEDRPDDVYRANIQIGELNALNASLAMIKYKQIKGFYLEEAPNFNILFEVADTTKVTESEL